MATKIHDQASGQFLTSYSPTQGELAVCWRDANNELTGRTVTKEDAQRFCDVMNAKERRSYRWFVAQCLPVNSQASLRHS